MIGVILFGVFVIALLIGIPISVSLGIAAMVTFTYRGIPIVMIGQRIFTAMDSFPLMAIPMFILAGNLMTAGGISKRIVSFVNTVVSSFRGSLGVVAIIACAIFASLSGSTVATTVAIGSIVYPAMKELGYPGKGSAGLISSAGVLGQIIPPSIVMIVYATVTNASIIGIYKLGFFWGVFSTIILCVIVIIFAYIQKWPKTNKTKVTRKKFIFEFVNGVPALSIPFIILGGIYSGLFTPTEAAGIGVVVAFVIGVFIYKELKLQTLIKTIIDSAKSSAMAMFIVACASSFAYLFSFEGLSKGLVESIVSANMSKTAFLFIISFVLIIFGMFMDGVSITVLLAPLLVPVLQSFGIDFAYFGIIFTILAVLGNITPPVAVNLVAMSSISGLSIEDISKGELVYFITYLLIVTVIILFPSISLFFLA